MKNNKTWIAVIVSAIIIAAFGLGFHQIFADPENDPLSTQEIAEIISERYPGEIQSIELDYEQGVMIYFATVITDKGAYHIKLNAKTGTVLYVSHADDNFKTDGDTKMYSLKKEDDDSTEAIEQKASNSEKETGTAAEKSAEITASASSTETKKNESTSESKNSNSSSESSSNQMIGIEVAKEIALSKVDGVIVEIELDSDDGVTYYEIEMKTNQGEVELEIHAYTGEILSFSKDSKSSKGLLNLSIDTSALIGVAEAKRIALQQFSGTVKEVELNKDDGRLYYEVEMKTNKGEVEIEIDAYTGKIISIEIDD